MNIRHITLAAIIGCLFSTTTGAAPVQPGQISSRATWMVHLDQKAVRESIVGQSIYKDLVTPYLVGEGKPELVAYVGLVWLNLQSLTIYGEDFGMEATHSTVVVAEINPALHGKAIEALMKDSNYRSTKTDDGTFFERESGSPGHTLAFCGDSQVVLSHQWNTAQSAVDVLAGRKPRLSAKSGLTTFAGEAGDGALLRVGAHKFNEDPNLRRAALLSRLTQAVGVEIGEPGYDLSVRIVLHADSSETASHMRQTIDGMASLIALSEDGQRGLRNLSRYFKAEALADEVVIKASIPVDEVQKALSEVNLGKLCGFLP